MDKLRKDYLISEIQAEKYEYVLNILSSIEIPEKYSIFIYGTGKQSKTTYQTLQTLEGVEVLWFEFILSGFLKILKFLIAGYAGLIKINNNKRIREIFEIVSQLSMAGIYVIDKKVETQFINEVKKNNPDIFMVNDVIINNSNNYFIYLIDNDSIDSETGISEIRSVGIESFLKDVL